MNSLLIKKYSNKDIIFLLSSFLIFFVKKEIWGENIDENELSIINEYILSEGYDDNIFNYIDMDFLLESIIENNSINCNIDENKLRIYLSNFIIKNKVFTFNSEAYRLEISNYDVENLRKKLETYMKMEKIPHYNSSIHIQKVTLLTNEYKSKGGEVVELFKKNNKCSIM